MTAREMSSLRCKLIRHGDDTSTLVCTGTVKGKRIETQYNQGPNIVIEPIVRGLKERFTGRLVFEEYSNGKKPRREIIRRE